MRYVFASNNTHKLSEVRAILSPSIEVLSLSDIGFHSDIAETGTTLSENSRIKAEEVWRFIQKNESQKAKEIDGVFADDTGLEIDALNGEPGVYTARWYMMEGKKLKEEGERSISEQAIFAANRSKALRKLAGNSDRGAQFKTVITLIRAKGEGIEANVSQVEGVVRGWIIEEERGEGGFGYDPIFVPEGYDKTFSELPAEVKNSISHRARALEKLKEVISDF